MKDMIDWEVLWCGVIVAIVVLGLAFGGLCLGESYGCSATAERMKMESSWGPAQGCMVKTEHGWRLLSSVREVPP